MDEDDQIDFHCPDLPPTSYAREDAKQPPSVRLQTFKEQTPISLWIPMMTKS